jgi:hypothetical protein
MSRSFFGKWRVANGKQIWQKCANLSFKFGVLFIGEIDQQFFCALATFR